MILLRNMIAVVLLTLWVPVTMHCQLESVFGLEALSCNTHEDSSSSTAHHEKDCEDDECAVVESGLYKLQNNLRLVPEPPQTDVALTPDLAGDALELSCIPETVLPPPELPPSWHFVLRSAPARTHRI